tara:strand:+ start:159 stop:299 length:141 start_codon:yes stop_codon:yes gene_type:complete
MKIILFILLFVVIYYVYFLKEGYIDKEEELKEWFDRATKLKSYIVN